MIQDITLFFDVVLSLLLIGVIFYTRRLDRKLTIFHQTRSEFEKIFKNFINATNHMEQSLLSLHERGLRQTKAIQDILVKGQYLIDDLEFLLKKSSLTIETLESLQKIDKESTNEKNKISQEMLDDLGLKKVR